MRALRLADLLPREGAAAAGALGLSCPGRGRCSSCATASSSRTWCMRSSPTPRTTSRRTGASPTSSRTTRRACTWCAPPGEHAYGARHSASMHMVLAALCQRWLADDARLLQAASVCRMKFLSGEAVTVCVMRRAVHVPAGRHRHPGQLPPHGGLWRAHVHAAQQGGPRDVRQVPLAAQLRCAPRAVRL